MNELENHPLNGVGLETLLGELVRHYGWEILGEQININCFKSYPNFDSSIKYLRKTVWAREKLEAFYLYKFKQYPRPSDEQHQRPPRNRLIDSDPLDTVPAVIALGDGEFFDDPISGPVFPSKESVQKSRAGSKVAGRSPPESRRSKEAPDKPGAAADPWANWKK